MDVNLIFRIAMVLQFIGYQLPRGYYRRRARETRGETALLPAELSESKWRPAFLQFPSGL